MSTFMKNPVLRSEIVQIRNTNVLDTYGNNTMLLQARDEEGMSYLHCHSVNILFTLFLKSSVHRMDVVDCAE